VYVKTVVVLNADNMAGKKPKKIFEYTPNGKYVQTFETMSDCRRVHFSHIRGKIPILRLEKLGTKYTILENGNILVKERIGRDKIKFLLRVDKSEYCTNLIETDYNPIEVYNLEGVLLLEARNMNVLTKMTGISGATVSNQLLHLFHQDLSFSF